ncbi:uncharacterized protein LOC118455940 [Neolamprologus brichardi]|uniref:uncharacterized protein LOC118455940 n=1 Tax=Neolamprologus brichardi TaxID=32507 RepID=UPI001643C615|nr:uncharacterized protein LOC118455940 [Neolamprologus brichardi]
MICRILLLIILTSCVSGSFVVNVTQTSYQAEENHNMTLEWTFTTKHDRSSETLFILCELFISDKLSVLYQVHEGVEVSESQDEKFSGRVQSDKDALREGRIRLQRSRLTTDNSGLYLCEVNTDYGFGVGRCRLNVTAAADEPKHQTPTMNPQTESRGSICCGFLGVEVSESQDAKFSGRVQSDKDALREGRIRLQLSRLRTDDSGLYLCEVNTDDGFSVGRCQLNVTAQWIEQ